MKLKDVFEKSVQFLKNKNIDNPRRDVELLISHALKVERVQIYLQYEQPLNEAEIQNCREAVRRRGLGEPLAYINQERGFFGEQYAVGEGVLIPRPETEMIVEEALLFLNRYKISEPKILDLGSGTGCIGFSILKNYDGASLISVEKSEAAFTYLNLNQERLGLKSRSQLILSDILNMNFADQKFDVIVANPPYIAENDSETEINVKKYEPHSALFSDDNGFHALYSWSEKVRRCLGKPGVMLFEMGHQQGNQFKKHAENFAQFSKVDILKDLSGLDRILKCIQY